MRKFWLTLAGVIGLITCILVHPEIDPLGLGIGIGMLLSPMAAANAMEHKFKNK